MSLVAALALAASTYAAPLTLPKVARVESTVTKSREDLRGGVTSPAQLVTTVYEKTIEARGDGYRVTLKPLTSDLSKIAGAADQQAKLQSALAGLAMRTYVFTADDSLAPLAMEDWPAVTADMRKGFAVLAGDSPDAAKALDATMGMFERMSPEQAASVMLKEDAFLSTPVNVELDTGKPVTYSQEGPNPLGGPPIRSNGSIVAERIDQARGVAVLRWSETLDPASASVAVAGFAKTLMDRMGPEAQKPEARALLDNMKIERATSCLYEVDLKIGLPLKADCEAKTAVTDPKTGQLNGRTERWLITQTLKN